MTDQITIDRAVAQQALEALEYENSWHEASRQLLFASTVDAITTLRAALAQAEPVQDFRLTECVFVGPPPAPHEDWHHAISAMLREKHISGLRISTATADDWNGVSSLAQRLRAKGYEVEAAGVAVENIKDGGND